MGADDGGIAGDGEAIDHSEKALVAFFFDGFVELAGHFGGGGVAAFRVAEDEGVVEFEMLDGVDGCLEIRFSLTGEADDDVGGDRDARPSDFHFLAVIHSCSHIVHMNAISLQNKS